VENLPIRVIEINLGIKINIDKLKRRCKICNESLVGMKIGDPIIKKTSGRVFLAHVGCGIDKNWIEKP